MRTRSGIATVEAGFTDNGYYRKMYANPNWRDTTDDRDLNNATHPFTVTGTVEAKKFNALQKAIIYCIMRNGGSCNADLIVRFLDDHWTYINSDRGKPLDKRPDLRILHINTSVKKEGLEIFKKDPRCPDNFMCNAPKGFKASSALIPTRSRNSSSEKIRVRAETEEKPREPERPATPMFDEKLLSLLKAEGAPMSLDEITQKSESIINEHGPFAELSGASRVRAVLIVLKSRKRVTFSSETGLWCAEGLKRLSQGNQETAEVVEDPTPVEPGLKISTLTLSELYAIVKSRHDV